MPSIRKELVYLAVPLLLAAACNRSSRVEREQRQYEVVQEGSAAAGTSTALGTDAVPPLTGTNADTTTAFTLDPRLSTAPPLQEPTIASGMPEPSYGSSPAGGVPAYDTPASPAPRSSSTSPAREPVRREPAPARPRTDPPITATYPPSEPTDTATAPPTDTTAPPTDTAPPPPREQPIETPPPTTTDTAPPPTTTDTRGPDGE